MTKISCGGPQRGHFAPVRGWKEPDSRACVPVLGRPAASWIP